MQDPNTVHTSVEDLLRSWLMPDELIDKLKDEEVDLEALPNLLLDDLKVLIPSVGLRTKFRVCWLAWKEKLVHGTEEAFSTSSATTTRSLVPSESSAEDTHERSNPLKNLLKEQIRLTPLLSSTRLTKTERCSLARCVVSHLIDITPGAILKPAQLEQWAQYVIELFPEEDKKFYYFSVGTGLTTNRQSFGSRQLPSKGRRYYGCLWDNWNNERKKLRSKNIISFTKKGGTSSDSSEITATEITDADRESCLKIVEVFQGNEITDYLRDAWKKSRQERLAILANRHSTGEYLKKFPVLKNQAIATYLIDLDFEESSSLVRDDTVLAGELQKHEQAIIMKAKEKYSKLRDKTQKHILDNIFKSIELGSETETALLLLPFLFSSGGKVNAKGQRASRAEAARTFISLFNSLADGEETILQQRKHSKGTSIQPLVIAVGSSWAAVTSAYVYVDAPLYRYNNILDAVQMCFKIFFAFDLKYPLECEHVWLLIQRGFFKIYLPNDKTILGVNQVLTELNISTVN